MEFFSGGGWYSFVFVPSPGFWTVGKGDFLSDAGDDDDYYKDNSNDDNQDKDNSYNKIKN